MQIGLVGMPSAGKTTLFNLLTGNIENAKRAGSDDAVTGSAQVPDARIDFLSALYKPKKTIFARIDFKDIPGVRMSDSKTRAAKILDEVRSADALVQVIRAFQSDEVAVIYGEPEPYKELTDFHTELLLADLDALERRIARLTEAAKPKKDDFAQLELLKKLLETLENEKPINSLDLSDPEKQMLAGQSFLSEKPLFLVVNLDENQLRSGEYTDREKIKAYAVENQIPLIEICAQTEMEISELQPDERKDFMEDLGITEAGLGKLTRMTYASLNLISFFTVGEDEVRAWTIQKHLPARQAAGKIHSDIERGFIRAEVFHYDSLQEHGSVAKVREAGLFRLEGKEYQVQDGDIISFRFNV